MTTLVAIIHVIVCVFLILVVLLQSGKGADLAGAFGGGGSQTALGARGAATFLGKLTTIAAIAFMLTAMTLSILQSRRESKSLIQDIPAAQATAVPEKAKQDKASPETSGSPAKQGLPAGETGGP